MSIPFRVQGNPSFSRAGHRSCICHDLHGRIKLPGFLPCTCTDLEHFRFIVFIVVIASFVQLVEMTVERYFPPLYYALGIFLPLITVNCAVLGVSLFLVIREYTLLQSLAYGAGSGIGWLIAILSIGAIREKIQRNTNLPKGLEGPAITLIITGILALAFIVFSGMIQIQ